MDERRIKEFALTLDGAKCDYPFKDDFVTFVLRHSDSRKWFGIYLHAPVCSLVRGCGEEKLQKLRRYLGGAAAVPVLNLKCEPALSLVLQHGFAGILPAYHMNKRSWISVVLFSDVEEGQIKDLVTLSYDMTK